MIGTLLGLFALSSHSSQSTDATYIDSISIAPIEKAEARATGIVFTSDPNILLVIARDMELRWIDIRKAGKEQIIKRVKLTEQPTLELSPEQKKRVADAIKMSDAMGFQKVPDYPLKSEVLEIPGTKEFCLTDRHDEFFFYSTETGELLRKKKVQKKGWRNLTPITEVSQNLKYANIGDSERKVQMIYDLDTGKLLFEVQCGFLVDAKFSADSKHVFKLDTTGVLTSFELPTGKKEWSTQLPQKSTGNLVVNPVGGQIAYSGLKNFNYDGAYTFDLETKKITAMSRDVKDFALRTYSPDGSLLVYYAPKWLHFVDSKTGTHRFTMRPYFSAMWDTAYSIQVSQDNNMVILVNDPANENIDLRYSIIGKLNQKPIEKVKKPIKPN